MKILIFHASAGHGHQKVAEVLRQTFLDRGFGPDEVILEDALKSTPFFFRRIYPAAYFYAVKYAPALWGWFYETLDRPAVYRIFRSLRWIANQMTGRNLLRRTLGQNADVILSTHFFPAELFASAKQRGTLKAHLITVITDFYPHTFWVNEGTDAYWVMGDEARQDLEKRGVSPGQIHTGGIPVDPRFQPSGRKYEILKRWNFDENRLTLLMTSGSFGLGPVAAILRALENFQDRIQCFVVCGMNQALQKTLKGERFGFPIQVFDFIDFMSDLMEASDLVIAKSGGSTTAETLVKGIPMIVMRPIPGQETRNATLLKQYNAAFFMEKPEQIKPIVQTVLNHPEILEAKKRQIHRLAKPHAADDLVSFVVKDLA